MKATDIAELFNFPTNNPWINTPLERYYTVGAKTKGVKGEEIAAAILKNLGYDVQPRTTPGHDRIVNGRKTEIKFSAASERNYKWQFTFNHIGFDKDWDDIIFVGVNGDLNIHIVRYTKEELSTKCLSHQQGGNTSSNDDFIIAGTKATDILKGGECLLNGMEEM